MMLEDRDTQLKEFERDYEGQKQIMAIKLTLKHLGPLTSEELQAALNHVGVFFIHKDLEMWLNLFVITKTLCKPIDSDKYSIGVNLYV